MSKPKLITEITAEMVSDEWNACYERGRVKELYPVPRTPLEVLTLQDGPWAKVPPQDRQWTVLRGNILPDPLMRLFAAWCAEQVLPDFEKDHPGDSRPRAAIEAARKYAFGLIDKSEMVAAFAAACAAARAAARSAACAAARAAARSAASAAAFAAVRSAVFAATSAAECAAARAAARVSQLAKLTQMVHIWSETGDAYGGERLDGSERKAT